MKPKKRKKRKSKIKLTRKSLRICALVTGPQPRTPTEIAHRYGVSRSAVYKRISRARKRLAAAGASLPPIPKSPRAVRVRPVSQLERNGVIGTTTLDDLM